MSIERHTIKPRNRYNANEIKEGISDEVVIPVIEKHKRTIYSSYDPHHPTTNFNIIFTKGSKSIAMLSYQTPSRDEKRNRDSRHLFAVVYAGSTGQLGIFVDFDRDHAEGEIHLNSKIIRGEEDGFLSEVKNKVNHLPVIYCDDCGARHICYFETFIGVLKILGQAYPQYFDKFSIRQLQINSSEYSKISEALNGRTNDVSDVSTPQDLVADGRVAENY